MECGECTECCKVLEIKEVESKPNEMCKHCTPKLGCNIYDRRPQGCKDFKCMWLQMNTVHTDLRPDKCGVLFEKFSDDVVMGGTGGNIAPIVYSQIKAFNKEGISVVLVNHETKSKALYPIEGHTKKYIEGVINDST